MTLTKVVLSRSILAILCLTFSMPIWARPHVIFDHDGGIDDFVALALLACTPKIHLEAVTFQPGDSYKEPAVTATHRFLALLGKPSVSVAASDFEGKNPFPAKWRAWAHEVARLPELPKPRVPEVTLDAPKHLVELLSGSKKYTIIAVGPMSNLAAALRQKPAIKDNIERIVIMGGAVFTNGNVSAKGHDGSAEWNIYNAPEDAQFVLASGIPMTWVPLDATATAPMRRAFVDQLAQQDSSASKVTHATLQVVKEILFRGTFRLWDALTAMAVLEPGLVTTKPVALKVLTDGPSQGRTLAARDGQLVDVAVSSDGEAFEKSMLAILRTCPARL